LVADISGGEKRGTAFGVYTFAISMGQVLGPLIGGQLYDNVAPSAPFYANTIVLWLGALAMALLIHDPHGRRLAAAAAEVPPREPPAQWPSAGGGN
jgi:MFS family permease